jgi:hypothetical protein
MYLGIPAGFSVSAQGGYARLCAYVQSYDVTSNKYEVYSNLVSAWGVSDLTAPQTQYQLNTKIGESQTIGGTNTYVCANLDVWNSNQNSFYEMSVGERANGLMINYETNNNQQMTIDVSTNQAYIEYVSCECFYFELI